MPIKALNQFHRDWKIKSRVLTKTFKKSQSSDLSILKLCLVDIHSTPIEAMFFGEAADHFTALI